MEQNCFCAWVVLTSGYGYSGEEINLVQFGVEKVKISYTLMQEELYGPRKISRTSMIWQPHFEW